MLILQTVNLHLHNMNKWNNEDNIQIKWNVSYHILHFFLKIGVYRLRKKNLVICLN